MSNPVSIITAPRLSIQRVIARLETVTDRQLFVFCVLWVVTAGLALQLVILPYVTPFAHAGHGLIANLDSPGFHEMAAQTAQRMRTEGVKDFGRWIDGTYNYPVAITGVFYILYPEPWVQLPFNGVLFGIIIITVRRILAVLSDSRGIALASLLPFFIFPSFVVIWGQPHRDLLTGTGFTLVLYALVCAAYKTSAAARLPALAVLAGAGMAIMWLPRPYALSLVAAGTIVFAILAFVSRQCRRTRLLAVTVAVLLAAFVNLKGWAEVARSRVDPRSMATVAGPIPAERLRNVPAEPATSPPADPVANISGAPVRNPAKPATNAPAEPEGKAVDASPVPVARGSRTASEGDDSRFGWSWIRLPHSRRVSSMTARSRNCEPPPSGQMADTLLYNLCHVREGFIAESLLVGASSGYDYDIRLRSAEDFVAYAPRAVAFALLAPGPQRWGTERTTLGRLATIFVPFEMLTAYTAFLLALVFGRSRLARLNVWAVAAFCITYITIYAFATPQLGGVYRMRAFAFAIVISAALAVALPRAMTAGDRGSASLC